MEILVKKELAYVDGSCTFLFQGGEPTLAGLNVHANLMEFVQKYDHKNLEVRYTVQTNGIVIREEWCRFFHERQFLVRISVDGTKDIHDLMRADCQGKSSHNRDMRKK